MTTIYVVTVGSYSDYKIDSIWSSPERAGECHQLLQDSGKEPNDVEEYTLDERSGEALFPAWVVYIDMTTGKTINAIRESFETPDKPETNIHGENVQIKKIDTIWNYSADYQRRWEKVQVFAEGRTEEEALKSARDFRAKWLAEHEGIS